MTSASFNAELVRRLNERDEVLNEGGVLIVGEPECSGSLIGAVADRFDSLAGQVAVGISEHHRAAGHERLPVILRVI